MLGKIGSKYCFYLDSYVKIYLEYIEERYDVDSYFFEEHIQIEVCYADKLIEEKLQNVKISEDDTNDN